MEIPYKCSRKIKVQLHVITQGFLQHRSCKGHSSLSPSFCLYHEIILPFEVFSDMRGNASPQPEGKKINLDAKSVSTPTEATGVKIKTSYVTALKVPASTSANDANPHFVYIIKPCFICKHFLYIPLAFAKSNGWMNRCCEMILMDEQQRSWSVRLGPVSDHHIEIHIGWQKFKEANDVQVGDIYRFELISNGKIPVAYFHRKYSGKDAKQTP